jgi:hypothetical protein
MCSDTQHEDRFDSIGLEVPYAEHFEETDDRHARPALDFGEAGFVTEPAGATTYDATRGLSWSESALDAAETAAAESSEAQWLETEWLETPAGNGTESVESYAKRLGRDWSNRRNGKPTPEAMCAWLIQDHADTMAGAKARWRRRKVGDDFWTRVTRGWMVAREENMHFQPDRPPSVAQLGPFAPPAAKVGLVSDALIDGSKVAPVAPLTLRFARALRQRYPGVSLSNYRGHGGGAFLDRGYSLDLFIPGRDARGFYKKEDAVRLLRAVNAAAGEVQLGWRAIYNDFSVADAINREFGRQHVIFIGAATKNSAKAVTGINWHGPDPLILHVHLDLAPLAGANLGEAASEALDQGEEWLAPFGDGEARYDEQTGESGHEERETEYRGKYDAIEGELEWLDEMESEANALEAAGLSPAERKALDITSTLETGKRGGFYGLSGNFDGQGLSFGLVNWTIGTGSLQPLLRDFAKEQPARWTAIFGDDAESFRALIMPKGDAATHNQHRFAIEQMNAKQTINGRTVWAIREPWRSRFLKLSEDATFRQIQIRYVRDLLIRAAYFCRYFGLKSERAFAFMFDAVSSHGKWWLTRKFGNVEKRRQLIETRLAARFGHNPPPERDLLLLIADILAETSAPRWASKVRARKRWFVTGEHPRAKELAGLEPSADRPWSSSSGAGQREDGESLAWLDFEAD